ncbi:hypothetical protein SELMODRAFT_407643 [Selaginella moellendorffii]|uniref:Uncharacterized protein n=1 Tax=Selaginella moellendorffii TaxID=88036 RepID=D8R698_SELML|nr:hypothetical protein SELMODRAFT_407643 [Selaginella moellendorffii]
MDQPALPLSYYCRSARLCLKKANFSRKAGLYVDELGHLKKFEALLLSTIPRHPNYHLNRGESQIADLQIVLVDVEKRIRQLEPDMHGRNSPYRSRRTTSKLKPPRALLRAPKTSRLHVEPVKSPKKARKSVKKTIKQRETWEDWSTRLSEAPLSRRSVSPVSRKSPARKIPKFWEESHRACSSCGHHDEGDRDGRWRFGSLEDRSGTDRLRDLSKKLLTSDSRGSRAASRADFRSDYWLDFRHREREFSGSPITRALAPLEDDFINLQALVIELKGSLDGFKLRFDEEGRLWRSRTENLEKDLQYLRHDMEVDIMSIKRSIQEEVKKTMEGLSNDLAAAEDLWALSEAQKKEKLQHVKDESSAMMEDLKDRMNFSFVETKAVLLKNVDEKISNSMGGIKTSLKSDFEILELGIARDVEDLKREMTAKCESFLTEVELAGMGGKHRVESLIKEALEKFLPHKLESLVGKERTVTEMKEALCLLWKEVEALSKSKIRLPEIEFRREEETKRGIDSDDIRRGYIRQAIESCFPQKESSSQGLKERSIGEVKDELRTLWSQVDSIGKGRKDNLKEDPGDVQEDSDQLKKQLHYVRKEAMQARIDVEDVKKDYLSMKRSVGDLEFKLMHFESLPQLLGNIEETKNKMDTTISFIEKEKNLAISAASDAASAASKAGQMVEDVIGSVSSEKLNARRKSCEFQESLALEKDMVAESAGAVLSEVRRKSLDLQESLEQDICKVKDAFATEVRRMSMDLNQEKEYATTEVREFQRSLKDAFSALEKERDAASSAASEITALAEKAEGLLSKFTKTKRNGGVIDSKDESYETELELKGKDDTLIRNLMILETRIRDTGKKVRKLENTQASVILSVDELRGIEKSAALLVPKFETAATVLKEVEKRVDLLENPGNVRRKRRLKAGAAISLDARLILLENRIDHVASATYTNLRILDTKVEKLSTGVQSALDGTTATDNKCSALGEEVVRVFRMFITARKPKEPEKKLIGTMQGRKRSQRWDTSGPGTQSRCICCNKGNRWTTPAAENPKCPQHPNNRGDSGREVRKINVRLGPESCAVRSESPIHCTIHTSPTKQLRSDSPLHYSIRTDSATKQPNKVGLLEMIESEVARVAGDGCQDGDMEEIGVEGEQANFRLESGRIHLNVRRV